MDRRLLVGAAVAVVVGAIMLWPRRAESPEAQVRALIAGCVAAAEKKDLGTIADAIADDFKGPSGIGKQEVKQLLLGQLFRNPNAVVVFNPSLDVRVTGDVAAFSGVFVFARGKDLDWQQPGDGVSRYELEGTLERRGGDWRITSAEWKR